jgi:hypothetical protein
MAHGKYEKTNVARSIDRDSTLLNSGNGQQWEGLHKTTTNTLPKPLTLKPCDSRVVLSAVHLPHSSLSVVALFPDSETAILCLSQRVKTAQQVQSCLRASDEARGEHRQGELGTENWRRKKFGGSRLASHRTVACDIVGRRVIADKTKLCNQERFWHLSERRPMQCTLTHCGPEMRILVFGVFFYNCERQMMQICLLTHAWILRT